MGVEIGGHGTTRGCANMRGKIAGVLVCALLAATLILSYDRVSRAGLTKGYREVILDCPLPEIVGEVPRLKVVYDDVSAEEAMNLAEEVFGFVGDVGEIEDSEVGGLKIVGPNKELELYSSGAIIFWNREENFSPLHVPDLPSNEEAACISENLIRRMEELGLIPPSMELQFEGVGPDDDDYIVWTDSLKLQFHAGRDQPEFLHPPD